MDPGELAGLIAPYVTGGGPGHAVGVYRGGALVAHAAAGCAVIEHDIPIGADTIFDIASASKQFTAACLLLLQRDGMLSLDEDLRRHLPELLLPVPVTLRQCLSHTSGLREYYSLCELAGVPAASCGWRRSSAMSRPRSTCAWASRRPRRHRPAPTTAGNCTRTPRSPPPTALPPGRPPSRSGLPRRGPCHRRPRACGRATASPSGRSPAARSSR